MARGTCAINATAGGAVAAPDGKNIHDLVLDLTADSAGVVDQVFPWPGGVQQNVTIIPDATDAPTALYDLTFEADGLDKWGGLGGNLSATAAAAFIPTDSTTGLPWAIATGKSVNIKAANMGAGKKTKVKIAYR